MNLRGNERLLDKLAAEYVLGTLRHGARRRFESELGRDPLVRRAVAEWQDRLLPMAQLMPEAAPPERVWRSIAARVAPPPPEPPSRLAFWQRLREDLRFWRGLGLSSTAAAVILAALLLARPPEPAPSYIATLTDNQAQPVAVVTGDARRRQLTIRFVAAPGVAPDRSLELWAVPKQGAPRSLGLVAAGGSIVLPLPDNAGPQAVPLLAVSLEPKGGSPNPNGPTGPIVYKGAWLKI